MNILLNDIAEINLGYSFRNKIENDNTATQLVLQTKDINDLDINYNNLDKIKDFEPNSNCILSNNDLILRSRGNNFNSVVFESNNNIALIAPLIKITIINNLILPKYLNWYINTQTQQFFSKSQGTFIRMISVSMLKNLEIVLISLKQQQQIIELDELGKKYTQYSQSLIQKQSMLINQYTNNILKG